MMESMEILMHIHIVLILHQLIMILMRTCIYLLIVIYLSQSIQPVSAKLYNCYISKDNITRNFIPCYSTTTVTDVDGIERPVGTVGMYDTVEGKFYVNKGTGTFGYETEDGTYVSPQNN